MESLLKQSISRYFNYLRFPESRYIDDGELTSVNNEYLGVICRNKYFSIFKYLKENLDTNTLNKMSAKEYLRWIRGFAAEKSETKARGTVRWETWLLLDPSFIFLHAASAYPELRSYFYAFFNEEDEKLLRSRLEIPTLQNLCLPVAATDSKVLQSIKSKPLQDEVTGSENFIGHFLRVRFLPWKRIMPLLQKKL